ncbi:hypothetical protein DL98DRAFT_594830 [Cadophora sp. DSE1049]|nr:hypothetical protein DL98DRAFT_594830 [Cadophora sp. DSE1049]
MVSRFPLSKVTPAQLQNLAKTLWSWEICDNCIDENQCDSPSCSWYRSTTLKSFFQLYEEEMCSYRSDAKPGQGPGLASHEVFLNMLETIKSSPDIGRADLVDNLFSDRPVRDDQERALDLAIGTMFKIDCSSFRQDSVLIESGFRQFPWRKDVTLAEFMGSLFTKRPHPNIGFIEDNLRAVKLKRIAALKFQPTDDIRCHLQFDRKKSVVKIFRQAGFLKEQLRLTKNQPPNITISESISSGALPRALTLEILHSIQSLLFPLTDKNSKDLLQFLSG